MAALRDSHKSGSLRRCQGGRGVIVEARMRFRNVAIEAVSYELPPLKVTSNELENRLNGTTSRLKLPLRPIEPLTGISERRFWDPRTLVSDVAAGVARKALRAAGIESERIRVL